MPRNLLFMESAAFLRVIDVLSYEFKDDKSGRPKL